MDYKLMAVPGLLLAVLCCIPRAQAHLRTMFSPVLRRTVDKQLMWVSWAQSTKGPQISTLVNISASTVTVEFFLLLLPLLMWTGYQDLCLQLTLVLASGTYVTCALKDIFCSPRPTSLQSTGQVRDVASNTLDASVEEVEYGAPSLHVCITICLTLRTLLYFMLEQSTLPAPPTWAYAAALVWIAWVAWGRLYLAAHTPIDLALGTVVGFSILTTCLLLGPTYTTWLATSPISLTSSSLTLTLLACFVMLRFYPLPEEYTTSYLYATTFLGAWYGFAYFLRTQPANLAPDVICPAIPAPLTALMTQETLLVAKLVVGYALALSAKILSKLVVQAVLQRVLDVFPGDVRLLWSPRVAPLPKAKVAGGRQTPADLEVLTKFFSYAAVALTVASNANLFDSAAACFDFHS